MKKLTLLTMLIPSVLFAATPNQTVLPDTIKVYYNDKVGLSRTPFKGGAEKVIQTDNDYKEAPGCYLSCISKDRKNGLYPVGDQVYVMGQIRVAGHYANGYCQPKGFANKDARKAKEFKEQCEKSFPEKCEKESCWVDTNTSALFY